MTGRKRGKVPRRHKHERTEQTQTQSEGTEPHQQQYSQAQGQPRQVLQQQPQGPRQMTPPQQHPQGAWGKTRQQQQVPGEMAAPQPQQHPQGAWGKTRQQQQVPGEMAAPQPQQHPQGAWGKTRQQQQVPGDMAAPQPQQHPQGAWGKTRQQQQVPGDMATPQPQQHPQGQGDSQRVPMEPQQQEKGIPQKSTELKQAKAKGKPSEMGQGTLEFARRITADKKSGRAITVYANFFPLFIQDPNIVVYHYNVTIDPDKPKFLLRDVWNKYMSLVHPGRLAAFDGKNAYSKGPLSDDTRVTTVTVINPERTGVEPKDREKEFKVCIEEVRRISFSCFDNSRQKMLDSRSMKVLPEEELSVLDIILRNWSCDNLIRSNKSFFHLSSSSPVTKQLSRKLDLRFGYFHSAFIGYRPYLNFDISHKAFYKPVHMLDIVSCFEIYNNLKVEDMNRFLRTVKVEYQLPNDTASRRIFRINKLVESAERQTFKKDDGSEMVVAQYFAVEKKCPLKYPHLPLLWVGPTQKSIYVPMEFCRILPDQVYTGLMDAQETRAMVGCATSDAPTRKKNIYTAFDKIEFNKHPLMKEFGLKVSTEMEKVPARVLDAPVLKTSRSIRVKDGVWRIQDFLEPVTLEKWCILILDKRVNKDKVMELQKMIKHKGNDFNMKISDPVRNPIEGDPSFSGLKKAFSQLRNMKMVFVIISDSKGVYSRVKAICETQEGILTQCIKERTLSQDSRKLSTTVENILLKVNAKLGGKNHSLDKNSVPLCLKGKVMIIGADVTHPSPGMKIPSVAAVTVSCDAEAFQYSTTTRVQPKGEMIKDMQEIISIHLKKFYELRQSYPEKIIFFRDGVSEAELEKVFKEELAAVRNACRGLCQPKITVVIVQKRHHTRLFPTSQADEQGKNFNVPVGTCVDSHIVHPRDLDFYLVSHASILGTARGTRYRVIFNDNQLTDEEVEKLSFYLCHLFARCNRSVSYPSPTYNAHLAAARVRAYLEGLNLMGGLEIENIKKQLTDNISGISPMYFV